MKFLFLEPFYGGSHKAFADGLVAHSRHEFDLLTLPARCWKWRMRGAALYFIKQIRDIGRYDGLIASDLMSLSDFKTLAGPACPSTLVYFHESQITYPLASGEAMDVHFGFTDITTGLAADRLLFNSRTHMNAFFATLPGFLGMLPEFRPHWVTEVLQNKADVCYPGCRFAGKIEPVSPLPPEAPLIIWNHRWEFDKNPAVFFEALCEVEDKGLDFRLALLGENFQMVPKAFITARERFKDRIVHYGYVASRKDYVVWLKQGAIVVSTARQENFGISVVEAIRHGCLPLLPNRLAYPEVLPEAFHDQHLYASQAELVDKLTTTIRMCRDMQQERQFLANEMGRFAWDQLIDTYDDILEALPRRI